MELHWPDVGCSSKMSIPLGYVVPPNTCDADNLFDELEHTHYHLLPVFLGEHSDRAFHFGHFGLHSLDPKNGSEIRC